MTSGVPEPTLHLLADLTLDVDGIPVQVHANGPELIAETEHPVRLARAAQGLLPGLPHRVSTRAGAAAAGRLLAEQGLTIRLRGPRGPVGAIGAGVDSPVGAAVIGSRRIGVAVPSAAARVLAALAVLGAGAWVWRRRRR